MKKLIITLLMILLLNGCYIEPKGETIIVNNEDTKDININNESPKEINNKIGINNIDNTNYDTNYDINDANNHNLNENSKPNINNSNLNNNPNRLATKTNELTNLAYIDDKGNMYLEFWDFEIVIPRIKETGYYENKEYDAIFLFPEEKIGIGTCLPKYSGEKDMRYIVCDDNEKRRLLYEKYHKNGLNNWIQYIKGSKDIQETRMIKVSLTQLNAKVLHNEEYKIIVDPKYYLPLKIIKEGNVLFSNTQRIQYFFFDKELELMYRKLGDHILDTLNGNKIGEINKQDLVTPIEIKNIEIYNYEHSLDKNEKKVLKAIEFNIENSFNKNILGKLKIKLSSKNSDVLYEELIRLDKKKKKDMILFFDKYIEFTEIYKIKLSFEYDDSITGSTVINLDKNDYVDIGFIKDTLESFLNI